MRHKTKPSFLGGPGILVLWLIASPLMIAYYTLKVICGLLRR